MSEYTAKKNEHLSLFWQNFTYLPKNRDHHTPRVVCGGKCASAGSGQQAPSLLRNVFKNF